MAIKKYLLQPVHNYEEGRILFERHSDDLALRTIFRSGASNYHHRRLLAELTILSETSPVENAVLPSSTKVLKTVVPDLAEFDVPQKKVKGEDFFSLPGQIQEVIRKKNMHHRRAMQLFIEIQMTEDREKRLEMALAMLDDHQKVNEYWSRYDEYKETGKFIEEQTESMEEKVASTDPKLIGRAIANLQSNISKDKKKLQELPEGHKRAKVVKRLQLRQAELDMYRKLLEGKDG